MDNLVSIIIPCYNGEKFIDQSIRSVWEQDYSRMELIVIDDGSVDRSRDKILAWQKAFHNRELVLKYIYQDNQGPGAATNYGLKHVTGKYLALLDADDVYLPGAIRKKAEFLDTHPDYAGVRNNGWRVSGENRHLFITDPTEKTITDLFTALSFGKTNNWAGTYMVRTDVLFEAYPDRNIDPSRLGQNFQILLPVSYGRKFGYIDEPLMEYRIQPDSHAYASDPEIQYQKTVKNGQGWRDIYRNVLAWLITDSKQREFYLTAYDSVYHRASMHRAAGARKEDDVHRHYRLLKQTGYLTLDDRIDYCNTCSKPLALGLRMLRKLRTILRGSK